MISSFKNIIKCPNCEGKLSFTKTSISCRVCKRKYHIGNGIPLFFVEGETGKRGGVTQKVKKFYEKTPFPNYEEIETISTLREKAYQGIFANSLDKEIPYRAKILEIGCGTGQMANLLGATSGREVYATDMSLPSLTLANNFRKKAGVENTLFLQMNLFKSVFKEKSFDYVLSNGVLHHTADASLAFKSISGLVKPGGYIIIGLYNKLGRLTTDLRRVLFRLFGKAFSFLDPVMRNNKVSRLKRETWYRDQYENPHESKHTIGEVQKWFEKEGFEFISSIPKPVFLAEIPEDEKLFSKINPGGAFDHFLVELGMLISGGSEGGFFVMIGKKKL